MGFTNDDLKDGMVCTLRLGGLAVVLNGNLRSQKFHAGAKPLGEYKEDLLHQVDDRIDIMKITYGGKAVFEREEWRELTIDEAFELLKSGPVQGQAYCAHKEVWATIELQDLRPWSECRYLAAAKQYRKFRIKK